MGGAEMSKVAITGANGQLGQELVRCFKGLNYTIYPLGKEDLDVTNHDQVDRIIQKIQPDIIIHCAAFTNVDQSERYTDQAFLVNGIGTRNIAVASNKVDAKLVYLSTNYVFDGKKSGPYSEYDSPNPAGIYGKSKLAGEQYVRDFTSKFFIVRTSWLFGGNGKNFVTTMQDLAKKRERLSVVDDQIGNPTYTFDLARQILNLISTEKYGIYHVSNSGLCSWYELAKEIFERSNISIDVFAVTTEDYNAPAPRPKNSAMEPVNLRLNNFYAMRNWKEALQDYIEELDRNALWKVN